MKLPFVSRDRFEEVRADLLAEREYSKRLWNFLVWRTGGGVAFDVSVLPEAYQPRPVPATPPADGTAARPTQAVRGPGQARRDIALFDAQRAEEYEDAVTKLRVLKAQTAPAAQKAVVEAINETANAAVRQVKMAGD